MASCANTLWMGDLEPYMDETFIDNAFRDMGEPCLQVKLIKNKITRLPAGYCFVDFTDGETAHRAMLRLNGKKVPGSSPPRRFKLNPASYGKEHLMRRSPEYSLFVGDITDDVDDLQLYSTFAKRYTSCQAAKVVLDNEGKSRGYGFVRFKDESDQQKALSEMQHFAGLGKKPIKVSMATPKRPYPPGSGGGYNNQNYYNQQYYNQYYNYGNWGQGQGWGQGWGQGYGGYGGYDAYGGYAPGVEGYGEQQGEGYDQQQQAGTEEEDALVDPEETIDVDKANREFMLKSEEVYMALEGSRWHPLDTVMSSITDITKTT